MAFREPDMEAVYGFEVKERPVTVAVRSAGESVHERGPTAWRGKAPRIPVVAA